MVTDHILDKAKCSPNAFFHTMNSLGVASKYSLGGLRDLCTLRLVELPASLEGC